MFEEHFLLSHTLAYSAVVFLVFNLIGNLLSFFASALAVAVTSKKAFEIRRFRRRTDYHWAVAAGSPEAIGHTIAAEAYREAVLTDTDELVTMRRQIAAGFAQGGLLLRCLGSASALLIALIQYH